METSSRWVPTIIMGAWIKTEKRGVERRGKGEEKKIKEWDGKEKKNVKKSKTKDDL